jgi:Flp pilus assembly protein TadG
MAARASRWKRFCRCEQGATFVEFAIIAIPLFLLFFGILDLGLIFWTSSALYNATADAARLVRTGQAQSSGMSVGQMAAQVCSEALLPNCAASIQISIQPFANFTAMTAPNPIGSNGQLNTNFTYNLGTCGQPVLINAYYEWTLVSPLTRTFFSNLADGNFLLQASAVFRNEPFC